MRDTELTWKVGGAQGEGIDSSGEMFALAVHRMGYYVYGYRHFQSLIKGGHTNYKVRVSTRQRRHRGDWLDLLVAFDEKTIEENRDELHGGSLVLYDMDAIKEVPPLPPGVEPVPVPMTGIAKQHGNVRMKNMVAMGATAAVLQLDTSVFRPLIADRFGRYGQDVVDANCRAIEDGYRHTVEQTSRRLPLPALPEASQGKKRLFMHGNDAVALGAVVGGCRVVAAYPITPATEILYTVLKLLPRYGGVVIQAEDEMAACQMAVGANFAGVRAMTSTSGPGFSLMTETLGLSAVSETPVVIVNVQRSGPSTGMPTKTEQGDLFQALFAAHGELQRIVLTPGTVEECFYDIQRAFNLADQYQCPVIVLTDLVLGLSKQSVDLEDIDFERIPIDRGQILTEDEVKRIVAEEGRYRRYKLTESGISPRALPGQEGGVHLALSYEHDELGEEMDDPDMRVKQTDKRHRKMSTLDPDAMGAHYYGSENPELLLIGWGSTVGPVAEARELLEVGGVRTGQLHLTMLHPFPSRAVAEAIESAKHVMVVENNSTAQLSELIRMRVGYHDRLQTCLKYDGNPFRVSEILQRVEDVFGYGIEQLAPDMGGVGKEIG